MNDYEQGIKLGVLAYIEKATDDHKTLIAFGMVPKELADEYEALDGELGRGFSVGLMRAASAPGGKGMVV